MERVKGYILRNFEQLTVLSILISVIALNYLCLEKVALLNFYYLPVLLSGFVLGQRQALLTAVFSVMAVSFYYFIHPASYSLGHSSLSLAVHLLSWASFLLAAGILVGYLYEEKERKISDLRGAYVGVLEILSKYLETADQYTKGHSVRVAQYTTQIAQAMGLPANEVENYKAAALLHDIGKIEVSTDLINKAASLTLEERREVDTHAEKGAAIISQVGWVLKDAVPIVLAHHRYFGATGTGPRNLSEVPLGARIIAVADSYDAMTTDRPYRAGMPPWQALAELEKCAGTQFDPQVVEAFGRVISNHLGAHQILSGLEEQLAN